jgi:hypothetical protein
MRSRLAAIAAALVGALTLAAPAALADGDPASDILLAQNVFYPYQPATSKTLMDSLNAATAAAAKAHFPLKIALIASPIDLGVIPSVFGHPQSYATFLEREISFTGPQLLLVVMKDGYGVQGLPAAATAAAAKLPLPSGATSDDLAKAALTAVSRLAAAAGHPVAVSSSSSSSSGGGSSGKTVLLIVLILAAVGTAGTLIMIRRREPT